MKAIFDESDPVAGACKYLLIMLIQRLEETQAGLIDGLSSGVAGDRAAIQSNGKMNDPTRQVLEQVEELLRQAKGA